MKFESLSAQPSLLPTPGKKINLEVVANLAGVSTATVSRVINGKPGVSSEKVAEIEGIINQLKFKPSKRRRNSPARENTAFKHGCVAIFVRGQGHYEAPELLVKQLEAISISLSEKQINPILIMGEQDPFHLPFAVVRQQIDGAIVFGSSLPHSITSLIEGVPTVWMTSHDEGSGEVILPGNFEIGQTAADFLIRKNCCDLLTINPFPENSVLRCRCSAFLVTMQQQGIAVSVLSPKNAALEKNDLRARILDIHAQILLLKQKFDGIFIPDDRLTAVAHPVLKESGVIVAGKTQLISCGNESDFLLGLYPRPATIDIGPEILGDQAVNLLLRMARGEKRNARVNVTISPRVIEGTL